MPVPYGFGVGDFVTVGTLAWNVYKSCKAAPESFHNISVEVLSLHAVLKEGEETLFTRPLPPARAEGLKTIKDGCDKVLVDLQSLVERYESLGTQSKRTWDRMKWGNEDIAEIRARLTSNVTMLTAFIGSSQISVETKLDKFMEEFRQGKKEGSIVSVQTVDSLSADDRAVWRSIRKELEDIGISVAAFDANRDFIFDWFSSAVETGAFEEQNDTGIDDERNSSEGQSDDEQGSQGRQQRNKHTRLEPLDDISDDQLLEESLPPKFPSEANPNVSARGPETFDPKFDSGRIEPKDRKKVPRVAALLAGISRPRQRLIDAVYAQDLVKALKILKNEASFHLLDLGTLDKALLAASGQCSGYVHYLLIAELIACGSNVNYISREARERTPLGNSVQRGSFEIVRLLIQNGADVSYQGPGWAGGEAQDFAPRACLIQNIDILRLLLSSGVDVNTKYYFSDHIYLAGPQVTLVHEAAKLGAFAALEVLHEFGAEVDAISLEHGTPLMIAVSCGHEQAARILLAQGADPNFSAPSYQEYKTSSGVIYKNPMQAAILGADLTMVELLLSRGAVPDSSTLSFAKLWAPFFSSGICESELWEIVKILEDILDKLSSK